jgi:hypothetical protein
MNTLALDIPSGTLWGDFFSEDSSISTIEKCDDTLSTTSDWEIVGVTIPKVVPATARPPKWCKHGNACVWSNCPFRHERCTIYDNWIARRKTGYSCRCLKTDPDSTKSPEDGGCKYDHRDLSKLQVFYKTLPASTSEEIWESFSTRSLEEYAADAYDVSKMTRMDKSLLLRSLQAADVEFEDNESWIMIYPRT